MYNKKRMDPNIEPCGMLHLIFLMKIYSCLLIRIDGVQIDSF